MNLDINDIILLKKEFNKNLNEFMDKKKIQIFFEKYFFILNKIKIMGKICKKFDKIINTKNMKNIDDKDIIEKIKDFQEKKIIINNINKNKNKKQYIFNKKIEKKNIFQVNYKILFVGLMIYISMFIFFIIIFK